MDADRKVENITALSSCDVASIAQCLLFTVTDAVRNGITAALTCKLIQHVLGKIEHVLVMILRVCRVTF